MKNNKKYNEELNKLTSLLNSIIESEEYTMLVESTEEENVLEYGIIGQKMRTCKFEGLEGELFWKFIYKGICIAAPDSVVSFMNVNAFGNVHDSVTINLNDRVCAIITNSDHKYDDFISVLQEITKDSEDISSKKDSQNTYILSKRIKSLH